MYRHLFLIALILVIIIFSYTFLNNIFTFENLNFYFHEMANYIKNNYILAALIYLIIYFLVVIFCLPFAWFITISGAMLFGWIAGSILSVLAAGTGACIVFLLAKSYMVVLFKSKMPNSKGKYNRFKKEIKKNAFFYLLSVRLMPIFPFVFINVASAIIGVKFRIFVITTFVGIIPGSIIYSLLGHGAVEIILRGEFVDHKNLYSFEAILGLIGLSIMVLLPIIIKKFGFLKK